MELMKPKKNHGEQLMDKDVDVCFGTGRTFNIQREIEPALRYTTIKLL